MASAFENRLRRTIEMAGTDGQAGPVPVTASPSERGIGLIGSGTAKYFPGATASLRQPLSIHPAPPTVTWSAVNAGSAIANAVRIQPRRADDNSATFDPDNDPHYEAVGLPTGRALLDAGDMCRADMLTGGAAQAARWYTRWRFEHTGKVLEIYTRALSTVIGYRIWVDGLPLTAAMQSQSVTATGRYRIILDFGSVGTRLVEYEPADPYFGGVVIEPTASVRRPRRTRRKIAVLGDSTSRGAAGVPVGETWVHWAAEYLNMDTWNLAIGGSGYIAAPSFGSRVPDVALARPDVLVIDGGQNDKAGNTTNQIIAAARQLVIDCRAASPGSLIILAGVHMVGGGNDVPGTALEAALRALSVEMGIPFISQRDPHNLIAKSPAYVPGEAVQIGYVRVYQGLAWLCTADHTAGASLDVTKWWATSLLTGGGRVGATDGLGNADVFMGSDGIHWTAAGHRAKGFDYGAQILPFLAGLL